MLTIGLLKELSSSEGRVLLTPEGVKVLTKNNIDVYVEHEAGEFCQFSDLQYEKAGAKILPTMEKVFSRADILLQVLPPRPVEFDILNSGHIFLSFLNLIHNAERLKTLLDTQATFISAELIQNDEGKYPLLMSMSDIVGKMAVFEAARLLTISEGGKGKLLSGTDSAKPATVTIIGAGKVGRTAAQQALTNGAHVNIFNLKPGKLDTFKTENEAINCFAYSSEHLRGVLPETDVLIIAVHSLTRKYDIKISKEMVNLMEKGSVLLDISAEQTNAVETSHVTSHEQPTYIVDGIVHYCVPNMAAGVPLTASRILTKNLLPYVKSLAQNGIKDAIVEEAGFIPAINIYNGKMTNRFLAEYFGHEFYNIFELLELNL